MNEPGKKKKLFPEFPPVETHHWEQKIREDLGGCDYNKMLLWKTNEGFTVQPYYRSEHLLDKEYLNSLPGQYPYTRGQKIESNDWEIRQDIHLDDIEEANQKSHFILGRGITSLGFICPTNPAINPLKKQKDFSKLIKDISFNCIGLHFICGHQAPNILKLFLKEAELKKIDTRLVCGSVDFDPLGYLTITGNYGIDEKTDFSILREILKIADSKLPNYHVLSINGCYLHNAGVSAAQELGYSLAMGIEYLSKLTDLGLSADSISQHLQFNFGVGSDYFMEIAKLRAARTLWAKTVEAFKPKQEKSKQVFIQSITSEWNQTIYDPHMNILRATTESMAAVIGGTDSLTVRPFTTPYKTTSKFSGRIARNIQIILKEEAYLDKIIDPSAGSYYIENLTDSLINEAWKIVLRIEQEGGYSQALRKGIIQKDIDNTANNRHLRIASRQETLIGTNKFPNADESMSVEVNQELAFPSSQTNIGVIKPIRTYRGGMEFEKLRLAAENHSKRPKVFLIRFGNHSMRRARAAFSVNFFGCAGYEIIDNPGFNSIDDKVKSALHQKADIIVLCSSDEEYFEIVPKVVQLVTNKSILVVAGAPVDMEELKLKGIKYFIHQNSNVLETLQMFHQIIGITK